MTASGNRTPILAHLPDLLLTVAFLGLTLATLLDTGGAAALAQELGYWLVYEFVGLFFLMFWAGLNEGRGDHPLDERFRVISTCAIYAASGLLMHALWAIPSSIVLVSSAGGIWALVNPFLREDRPTPFRQGQETALAFVSLLVSFFGVGFFASLASQLWPWALSRATFDSVFGIAIGSVYFLLRWFLIFRLGPPLRPARRRKD